VREIDPAALAERLAAGAPTCLVDVREPWEVEQARFSSSVDIPLGELADRLADLPADAGVLVVTVCHHGIRSVSAAMLIEERTGRPACSLAGGIDAWARRVDPAMPRY
jgi:rhodanese-related sulfurtransferase